jgi:hypothetical protein
MDELDIIASQIEQKKGKLKPQETAQNLVETAFNQAIVNRVVQNKNVQKELLDSADKVIHNKMNAVKARAEQEDKEKHFSNKKGACECFGYNEATTEKWAISTMNVWHNIMTAIWLAIGFFTFAPVTFIAKKITVIFKKSWVAVVVALLIYFAVLSVPVLVSKIKI